MTQKKTLPPLRIHKHTQQAYVLLDGHRVYLGKADAPDVEHRYNRVLAEWSANGRRLSQVNADVTVTEIMAGYVEHCQRRFEHGRSAYKNNNRVNTALRPVKELYGRTPAARFGPRALQTIRDCYVKLGWSRKTVNERVQIVRSMFKWAAREELIPANTWHALQTVEGLRPGETSAREPRKILPVPDENVAAVLKRVLPPVAAMIRLQMSTGMRPGEAVQMRGCDLDTTGQLWIYRPQKHKSAHRGIDREIVLGPKAQAVLKPFLRSNVEEHLFRPDEAVRDRRAEIHGQRRTAMSCGNTPDSNRSKNPKRCPGNHYTPDSYRQAITRACEVVNVPVWMPHALRHSYATRIRKEYGIEAARVMLGHQHVGVTEIYAERDKEVAVRVAKKLG